MSSTDRFAAVGAQDRRERERAQRERLIVAAARELAEADGWDAVTTRRLADRIEYSQPVLYGHFPGGKDAIVGAVAVEGFAELAAAVRAAVPRGASSRDALAALAAAYLDFAAAHPAVYDAMFTLRTDLPFADDATPQPLKDAFAALEEVLGPAAGAADPGTFTEVGWAALHGMATLARAGRLRPEARTARLDALVGRLADT